MKKFAVALGVIAAYGFIIVPVFHQAHGPNFAALRLHAAIARDARFSSAVAAFNKGDLSQTSAVRAAIREVDRESPYCLSFAKALAERGEPVTAFKLESERAHLRELSIPDDSEMSFYADLADKTGHPDEGCWARSRMGTKNHFRLWQVGIVSALAQAKRGLGQSEIFDCWAVRSVEDGRKLFPGFRTEIDVIESEILRDTSSQLQAISDRLKNSAASNRSQ